MDFSSTEICGAVVTRQSVARDVRLAMKPEPPTGRLRIGAMESTAAARLPTLLSAYHSRWPQVDLEISIGTSRSLVEDVENNRLDCAFAADAGLPVCPELGARLAERGLNATRAYTEDLLLVLPPNHPPANGPQDLKITTLAAFPNGCTYRRVLEHWLGAEDGAQGPYWTTMEQASYHTMLACVATGSCFALCPKSILDLQRAPLDLRTQELATIDTYLVTRTAYTSSAYDALLRSVRSGRLDA